MVENRSIDRMSHVVLFAAWIGIWGAWIPAEAVALRQNAIDLAEWATFLPEVRSGALHSMPDILRLSVALLSIAAAWKGLSIQKAWRRWLIVLTALLPGFLLLPPYPFVLQLWNSDSYGLRFLIASLTIIGVGLSLLMEKLPAHAVQGAQMILTLASLGAALYAYSALREPFSALFGTPIRAGWGFVSFLAGAILSVILEGGSFVIGTFPPGRSLATKTGQDV